MELLDLTEAAALARVSSHTLRNYIRTGQLTAHGTRKRVRIDRAQLETLFAPRHPPATAGPRIFAVCNHKGGVGKTTTVAALGWYFGLRGRTLMIDADPQAHLTQVWGIDSDKLDRTLYEVLVKGWPIIDVLQPIQERFAVEGVETQPPQLSIIGSNLELADTTLQVTGKPWWANLLRNALRPALDQYSYILIDCPPSLDALTVNAIAASTDIIVPVDMGAFSLRGTVKLMDIVRHVCEGIAQAPKQRFLACRVEPNQFTEDVLEQLWRHYGNSVYRTVIRKAVDVGRAQMYRKPLPVLFPNNPGAQDYAALAKEILDE